MIRVRDPGTSGARILISMDYIMIVLDARSASAPLALAGGFCGLIRWVCTSNPFYVLSALLVCLGLWVSFGAQVEAYQTWALLFGMAGYTLLLAVTACLLVRFVGVWDDVRTVLLHEVSTPGGRVDWKACSTRGGSFTSRRVKTSGRWTGWRSH
jgi:hypothetical protein